MHKKVSKYVIRIWRIFTFQSKRTVCTVRIPLSIIYINKHFLKIIMLLIYCKLFSTVFIYIESFDVIEFFVRSHCFLFFGGWGGNETRWNTIGGKGVEKFFRFLVYLLCKQVKTIKIKQAPTTRSLCTLRSV